MTTTTHAPNKREKKTSTSTTPAAPAPPPSNPPAATSATMTAADRAEELRLATLAAADAGAMRLARGEQPSDDEIAAFSGLGWYAPPTEPPSAKMRFATELDRQVERCTRVLALQQQAGSGREYRHATQAVETTARQRDETVARLAEERARIDREIAAAQGKADEAAAILARMDAARAQLTRVEPSYPHETLLPAVVYLRLASLRRRFDHGPGNELRALRSRLKGIAGRQALSELEAIALCRSIPDLYGRCFRKSSNQWLPEAWRSYCTELSGEASEIEARIAELLPAEEACESERTRLLNFYLPESE